MILTHQYCKRKVGNCGGRQLAERFGLRSQDPDHDCDIGYKNRGEESSMQREELVAQGS
jgi:hypothetical protein